MTAIKFSTDFKYFISGDQDGVIHHYQRNFDESNQVEDLNASMVQEIGGGRFHMVENSLNSRKFPFNLKVRASYHINQSV